MLSGEEKDQSGPSASLKFAKDTWSPAHQEEVIWEQALQGKAFKPNPKSLLFVTVEIHLEVIATNTYIPKTSADCRRSFPGHKTPPAQTPTIASNTKPMASCKSDGVGFEGLQVSTRTRKAVQNVKKISHSHSCAAHAWQADFKYLSLQLADMGGGELLEWKGRKMNRNL